MCKAYLWNEPTNVALELSRVEPGREAQLLPHTWLRSSLSLVLFVMKGNFRGDSLWPRGMLRHTGVQESLFCVFFLICFHMERTLWGSHKKSPGKRVDDLMTPNPNAVRKLRDNSCSIFTLSSLSSSELISSSMLSNSDIIEPLRWDSMKGPHLLALGPALSILPSHALELLS